MDEFQQRLLAAVEKSKRNRFLAVINSAFFLWAMSALLLSIGGSYITNHKQCLDDAEKIIERRNHLSLELLSRYTALALRVKEAKTREEADQELSTLFLPPPPAADQGKRGSIYPDLYNLTYLEIETEFNTLTDRIKYAEFPNPSIAQHKQESEVEDEKMYQAESTLNEGRPLGLIQAHTKFALARLKFEMMLDVLGYYSRPNCSITNVTKLTFGYRPPIVFAEINPVYTTAANKRGIEDAFQDLEQKQKDLDSEVKKANSKP